MTNGTGTLPSESRVYVCEANVKGAAKCQDKCDLPRFFEDLKMKDNAFYMDYLNVEDCIFNAEALLDHRVAMKILLEDDPAFFSHLTRLAIQRSEGEPLTEEWITSQVMGTNDKKDSGTDIVLGNETITHASAALASLGNCDSMEIGLGNETITHASADLGSLGNCDSLDIGFGNGTTTPASACLQEWL